MECKIITASPMEASRKGVLLMALFEARLQEAVADGWEFYGNPFTVNQAVGQVVTKEPKPEPKRAPVKK